jgi:glutaminase
VLAVMATAGMYETSGDWLYEVGLPGKSGVGGGIITIAPGKGGMGTFSPKLDRAGNSVRGQLATKYLSTRLGLNIFASEPDSAIRRNKGRGSGETPTMLQENNSL